MKWVVQSHVLKYRGQLHVKYFNILLCVIWKRLQYIPSIKHDVGWLDVKDKTKHTNGRRGGAGGGGCGGGGQQSTQLL